MNESDTLKLDIYEGKRITPEQALMLFGWDIISLGTAGDYRRKSAFPHERVAFIIDRIINYSNICEARCRFCAYYALAGRTEPYSLSSDEICKKIEELIEGGGTQVMLQGGLHPDLRLDFYLAMIRTVRERFPDIYLHSFSPSELVHIARKSGLSLSEVIKALKEAGLNSVPGASDLLVDRIRSRVSPKKCSREEWCEVIRTLHRQGMTSTATMTYGMGESLEERIAHLKVIRDIQDETGILRAFIPWSFSPARTAMEHIQPATGLDYLRMVAIARIFLDNITHIQAGWLTEGVKLAQIALSMGANDMGGVLTEEVVVKATGIETRITADGMIALIRDTGKIPVQRDSQYREIRSFI